jgi:hypothetical protein
MTVKRKDVLVRTTRDRLYTLLPQYKMDEMTGKELLTLNRKRRSAAVQETTTHQPSQLASKVRIAMSEE